MKLRLLVFAFSVFLAAQLSYGGVHIDLSSAAKPEAVWSVRLYPAQFQTGVAGDLLRSLGILTPLQHVETLDPMGLESLQVTGYGSGGKAQEAQFLADLTLTPSGKSADEVLQLLSQKYQGTPEAISGHSAIRFSLPLGVGAGPQDVWLVKVGDKQLLLSPLRSVIETALTGKAAEPGPLGARRENEIFGGMVELDRLAGEVHDSELLAQLQHLEFHIQSAADALKLGVSAALKDGRSAKRVARMLEGMITMMSLDEPAGKGPTLDERLQVTTNGGALEVDVALTASESQQLIEALTGSVKNGVRQGEKQLFRR